LFNGFPKYGGNVKVDCLDERSSLIEFMSEIKFKTEVLEFGFINYKNT